MARNHELDDDELLKSLHFGSETSSIQSNSSILGSVTPNCISRLENETNLTSQIRIPRSSTIPLMQPRPFHSLLNSRELKQTQPLNMDARIQEAMTKFQKTISSGNSIESLQLQLMDVERKNEILSKELNSIKEDYSEAQKKILESQEKLKNSETTNDELRSLNESLRNIISQQQELYSNEVGNRTSMKVVMEMQQKIIDKIDESNKSDNDSTNINAQLNQEYMEKELKEKTEVINKFKSLVVNLESRNRELSFILYILILKNEDKKHLIELHRLALKGVFPVWWLNHIKKKI